MVTLDLKQAGLSENPFRNIAPVDPAKVIWADMTDVKNELDSIFREALITSITQVVLNRGPFGGGKTHASRYYSLNNNLPPVKGKQVRSTLSLYTRVPKDPGKADQNFYISLLESLKLNNIRNVIKEVIATNGEAKSLELLQDHSGSEDIGLALWMYGNEEESERIALLRSFLLSGLTKTEMRKLGLGRGITTLEDRFKVLGTVFQSYIGFSQEENIQQHLRLILWIDEMEDLIYFTSKQYRPFTQAIRDLIDRLPNYFTIFLNFTLAEPEADEDIYIILGGAVKSRISNQVYFKELNLLEAKSFVADLLAHFRSPETKNIKDSYYPFEEATLDEILEGLVPRTPRNINIRCGNIINAAIQDGVFSKGKERKITRDYVKSLDELRLNAEID